LVCQQVCIIELAFDEHCNKIKYFDLGLNLTYKILKSSHNDSKRQLHRHNKTSG